MISISGLFYTFEALICLGITLKLWQSYQRTKNPITKNFIYFTFFLTLSFFLFGLPSLIVPELSFILKTAYLIALIFLFFGCAFSIKSFISTRLKQISPQIGFVFTLAFGFVIILVEALHFGQPKLIQGIIIWNLQPIATLIFSFLILLFTIPLTIEFLRHSLKNPKIRTRCFWLAATFFLAGIGGFITHLNVDWPILTLGHIVMAFGFIFGAIAFIFTKPELT